MPATAPLARFWRQFSVVPISQNVWKDAGGVWHTGAITSDDVAAAQVVFYGGSTYEITSAMAAELTAAGFEVTA